MAKCETKTEPEYLLTLTRQEAEYLKGLLGHHILGPDEGPRGVLSEIHKALFKMKYLRSPRMQVDLHRSDFEDGYLVELYLIGVEHNES